MPQLPTLSDLVALAGPAASHIAQARLRAAMAQHDFTRIEHYSTLCRELAAREQGRAARS